MSAGPVPCLIRPARDEDLPAVERIERACFADPWSRDALWSEIQSDFMRRPRVAERGGEVVGYLMAWSIADQLHVLNIAVDPDLQRDGLGTVLLQAALDLAREEDLREIILEVRDSNTSARAFYRHHGFDVVGRRPRYYADNGEDALIMTLELPPPSPRT